MQIFATTPAGTTLAMDAEDSATVGNMLPRLQGAIDIPFVDLFVAFAGVPLADDQVLANCGVGDGSTIVVSGRLSGGGDGTEAFGKMHKKTHGLCPRCGKRSYHKQNKRCAACGYPAAKKRSYEWSKKSKRRTAPGTGRCSYTKHIARRAKNGFRSGTVAPPRQKNQK
eukprot:TRINITY_DN69432_c0_g1_i1.p1 TRINITY_DN69432_c0_g1~~TRINITY_DN69432_c0_g1_i1.p1  ORF type:complete len:168 (-),score=19.49 TRINITY_DN69432_c0_g1_i1:135-638(-)